MAEHKNPVIVGIGELLWDMLPTGKRAGGAPVNFVYHAIQNGADGYAVSAIGNDSLGQEILQELNKKKISYFIKTLPYPTGYVDVLLKNGIPAYRITENVAWDYIPFMPEAVEILNRTDAVCFGTLALRNKESRQNILKMVDETPDVSVKFFDINLRADYFSYELIDLLLQKTNIFKINDEEISVLKHLFNFDGNEEQICQLLLEKYNLKYLIFTAGEKFSIVYTQNESSYIETPKVKVVDTVGAGDAFSGTFVCEILKGKNVKLAHKNAVEVSAFVCTQSGAWPEYSSELKEKLNKKYHNA